LNGYELVLSEAAAMKLAAAARPVQRRLAVILDEIKASPFRSGDLQERDAELAEDEAELADEQAQG
jgi:hypothetical protein